MEHIKRMETELREVEQRLIGAMDFKKSPVFKILLDEAQQLLLIEQITHMQRYVDILEIRINYDKIKENLN